MNKSIEYFKLVIKQFILNLKFIYKKPSLYVMVSFFILISVSMSTVIFPLYALSGFQIGLVIGTSSGIIYADIHYNWRKSTLYKNSKMNGNDRSQLHLSTYLTIFLLEAFISIFLLLTIYLFNFFDFLMVEWVFESNTGKDGYSFIYMDIFGYFWSVFWFFTVMFAISFVFQKFIVNVKTYYLILLIIIIIMFLFGGLLNDYFYTYVDNGEIAYVHYYSSIYPDPFFWVSLFFPFYGPGQIGSMVFDNSVVNSDGDPMWFNPDFEPITWVKFQSKDLYKGAYKFNLVIVAPAIWTMFLGIVGIIIPNKNI